MSCNQCSSCGNTEIQENSVGVLFKVTLIDCGGSAIDISSVITKQFWFQDPNNATYTKTATFVTDGTDGQLEYVTGSGFLTPAGKWRFQAFVASVSGNYPSEIQSFKVKGNLQ